ncbi:MAG: twin-arginine translocation signal domain-containing protein, partial [Planctomycetota bacterium]
MEEKMDQPVNRRSMLKGVGLAAVAATTGAVSAEAASPDQQQGDGAMPANPYGGGPGTGLSLPPYFKPTKYVKNNN